MRIEKVILLLGACMVLTGCSVFKQPDPIVKVEIKTPPEHLLKKCQFAKPPAVVEFNTQTWEERYGKLAEVLTAQYANTAICQSQIDGIRAWGEQLTKPK